MLLEDGSQGGEFTAYGLYTIEEGNDIGVTYYLSPPVNRLIVLESPAFRHLLTHLPPLYPV